MDLETPLQIHWVVDQLNHALVFVKIRVSLMQEYNSGLMSFILYLIAIGIEKYINFCIYIYLLQKKELNVTVGMFTTQMELHPQLNAICLVRIRLQRLVVAVP